MTDFDALRQESIEKTRDAWRRGIAYNAWAIRLPDAIIEVAAIPYIRRIRELEELVGEDKPENPGAKMLRDFHNTPRGPITGGFRP